MKTLLQWLKDEGLFGWNYRYLLLHPWVLFVESYYRIKWFIQRGYRGYSDPDNWAINSFLVAVLIPMLQNLAKTKHGHPIGLTPKRWQSILDKMILGFIAMRKLEGLDYNWRDKKVERALRRTSRRGLKLFVKHFDSLWD